MQKSWKVLIVLSTLIILGYYFWAWPLYVLRWGLTEGTDRYSECFITRGRSLPVAFSYPQNGAQNVPTHSLVVIKLKDGNKHILSSSSISYSNHASSSPSTFSGMSAEYFIAGNYFPEDALKINPDFPDKFPDIDSMGRVQDFEARVKAAGSDLQKLAALQTEGAWEPNQVLTAEVRAACYDPYRVAFRTGSK